MILELGAGGASMIQPPKPGSNLAKALEDGVMRDTGEVIEIGNGCSAYVPNSRVIGSNQVMPDKHAVVVPRVDVWDLVETIRKLDDSQLRQVHEQIKCMIVERWAK